MRFSSLLLVSLTLLTGHSFTVSASTTSNYGVIDRHPIDAPAPIIATPESKTSIEQYEESHNSKKASTISQQKKLTSDVSDQHSGAIKREAEADDNESSVITKQALELKPANSDINATQHKEGSANKQHSLNTQQTTQPVKDSAKTSTTTNSQVKKTLAVQQSSTQAANELAKILAGIKDMEAKFQQQTTDEGKGGSEISRGKMALKRPNYFRWEVIKPFPQLVVSDAIRVWLYDRELEQVTIQKINNQPGMSPARILTSNASELNQQFRVEKTEVQARKLFTLKPKNKESVFDQLQLTFENGKISHMIMHDLMGSKTSIQFTKVWVNIGLDQRIFDFRIPKGVDVISEEE